MDLPSYLLAIQSLDGENPGDKYKELHSIAAQIIKNDKEREEFISTGFTKRVQLAMLPHLRILVGNKLKLNNSVIDALKSDDMIIIRQALNAKWFYSSSNDVICVDYFVSNVIPYISVRTRLELVKTLAHCLIDDSKKADDFFSSFVDLFGVEQALPLIIACSENYIYNAILNRKIILPSRILVILYRKYPELVIRYLQLGNEKNEKNKNDRNMHSISLSNYSSFLPMLVKYHTQAFVELFECYPKYAKDVKLGSTRAEFFLRNATDILIKKPRIFLHLLPLKLVSNKLSTQQFETMFENLFLKDIKDFSIVEIIKYLEYYPQEKKLDLLMNKYKLLYGEDLLKKVNIFDSDFYKLLPADMKEEYGRRILESFSDQSEYNKYIFYLPPKESIPLLKERIKISSDVLRHTWLSQMIKSCALYDSKEDLLDVLNYYNTRHINERACVLHKVFDSLTNAFDIKSLSKAHWQVLKQIIKIAYIKGDLFLSWTYCYEQFFKDSLHYVLKQSKSDPSEEVHEFLDLLLKIIMECYIEHDMLWDFIVDSSDIERDCLQKFLLAIPEKYPETSKIWEKMNMKLNLTTYLIQSMHDFNVRHFYIESIKRYNIVIVDSGNKDIKRLKFTIRDYPWLLKCASDLLNDDTTNKKYLKTFRQILRTHDLEFYQFLIDNNPVLINDIESSDALMALKDDPKRILQKWKLYLQWCRERVQLGSGFVKRFILAIRWCHKIPMEFLKQCLLEIEEKNSILILGILLEGEIFGQVIQPYLPKLKKIDIEYKDAKMTYHIISCIAKGINFSNPPVSFDVITSFCQGDFVVLATNILLSIAQRIPIKNVLAYSYRLIDKPISIKKLGIRMVFQVATNSELQEFLIQMWKNEKNLSIRELVANKIFDVFKKSPSIETWILVKACFEGMTHKDQKILQRFMNLKGIDMNFVAMHVKEFLNKIDTFTENDLDEQRKETCIYSLVNSIDENIMRLLPEELITDIVSRYLFTYPAKFIFQIYLLSDVNKFRQRSKLIMKNLGEEAKMLNKPSPKSLRYYPANNHIHTFFKIMINQLLNKENREMGACVINDALELFSAILRPYQDLEIFIALSMCKNYYEAKTPQEFGVRFGKNIACFVKDFGSEIIVNDIAEIMQNLLEHVKVYKNIQKFDLKLIIIKGLMESDEHYGTLVGIKLVHDYEVKHYNDSYDELMEIWKGIKNVTIQTLLSELMNRILYFK